MREKESEAGSCCYAAGYTDIPQFFKTKLTDNDDGRKRVKVTCTSSPRCLVFPRPASGRRAMRAFGTLQKCHPPFEGWREPLPASRAVCRSGFTFAKASLQLMRRTCVLLHFLEYITIFFITPTADEAYPIVPSAGYCNMAWRGEAPCRR